MAESERREEPTTQPIIRAKVLHFDPVSGLMRLMVSPEADRTALRARLDKGETVAIEIRQTS